MISVNLAAARPETPLRRPWERLICAGRAHEGLREGWRNQLRRVQEEIGFDYIRFHGIFMDEMMVYTEDEDGAAVYNWRYVDDLFDFLLSVDIRPFVELAFMPAALSTDEKTIFWWRGRMSPPSSYDRWGDLVTEFVRHCVRRYGLHEVRSWYFEVWNEPNLKDWFFSGDQADYFRLYEVSAAAVKAVDAGLRIGGPATSNFKNGEAPWVRDFIGHCTDNGVPLDFVSVHPYPNTFPLTHGGGFTECYREPGATSEDLKWTRETLDAAGLEDVEVHVTEWNVSPNPRDLVHDTAFMAPFVIKNALESAEFTDSLGFWVFTDIFEETAAGVEPFHGGFGLINHHGIVKPAYHGFAFLSELGDYVLASEPGCIVTGNSPHQLNGEAPADSFTDIRILLYHYVHFTERFASGDRSALRINDRYRVFEEAQPLDIDVMLESIGPTEAVEIVCSRKHGSAYDVWANDREMREAGSTPMPVDLRLDQERALHSASEPRQFQWSSGESDMRFFRSLSPHEVRLIKVHRSRVAGGHNSQRRNP